MILTQCDKSPLPPHIHAPSFLCHQQTPQSHLPRVLLYGYHLSLTSLCLWTPLQWHQSTLVCVHVLLMCTHVDHCIHKKGSASGQNLCFHNAKLKLVGVKTNTKEEVPVIISYLSPSVSVQNVLSMKVDHWSTRITNACFLILSLARMLTLAVKNSQWSSTTNREEINSRSILNLLRGSTPAAGFVLKPWNPPSERSTNHLGLQFLMYSPGWPHGWCVCEMWSSISTWTIRLALSQMSSALACYSSGPTREWDTVPPTPPLTSLAQPALLDFSWIVISCHICSRVVSS